MKFSTFAHVVSPDDIRGGEGGRLLKDLLEESGGRYEHRHVLPDRAKNDIRKLAEATSNPGLAEIAEKSEIVISLEHLRDLDPNTTRIRIGARVDREDSDPRPLPGFDR
ncbi:hypothetical protein [Frankia gtarii]|uniref:hypothetical protein n=1 Tax=Frankia gtarii TaxID=2950102 RepID=UPI0021BEAFE5|nr:hypothetical protein [Frankia gtarii]